jgi:alkylation response protein AidB-like acyl-CoA dehydrogenase
MYQPPIKDYEFLLRRVFDGQRTLDLARAGDLALDDAIDVLGYAGTLAAELIAPLDSIGDGAGSTLADGKVSSPSGFADAYKVFAENGWVGLSASEEYGGGGMPLSVANAANEFFSAANAAFSMCPGLSQGAIAACEAVADESLKRTYLEPLVSGRWTGTMDMTEPQAGTDLAAIRTIARAQGDGTWAVTGQKIFISWGDHDLAENIVHLVLARTPDAPAGLGGLSLFLVPKFIPRETGELGERNAIETVSLEHKLGIRASPTCVLDYAGATGYLLGELHRGLQGMFVMMNAERLGIGVQAVGIADRAYQKAHAYAAERIQGKVAERPDSAPIAEHPDVRRLLLSMRSTISAMRALCLQVSTWLDRGEAGPSSEYALAEFFVPIAKGWCTETCVQIASDAVQVHGGMGFIEETGVAQHYRDARIVPIYEGTTAAHANDLVHRKLLRDAGSVAGEVLGLIAESAALLPGEEPVAQRLAGRLETAVQHARNSTEALVEQASSPRDTLAVAVPYLMQLGTVAGGWMHARLVTAALASPSAAGAELQQRLTDADFYGAHQLSKASSFTEIVQAGEIGIGLVPAAPARRVRLMG